MLFVDIDKIWNRNVHLVWPIYKIFLFLVHIVFNTFAFLVMLNGFFNWVRNLCESFLVFFIDKFLFLYFNLISFVHFPSLEFH